MTASLRTEKLRGSVGRGITVYSNDPVRSKILLSVRALVLGSVTLLPHESLMIADVSGRRQRGQRNRLLVRKEPTEDGELQISGLKASAPWLKASVKRLEAPLAAEGGLPPGSVGDWLLEIDLAGDVEFGRHNAEVTFTTGLARQPEVKVPVLVNLRPPLHLSVNELAMPAPSDGSPSTKTVVVSVRRGLDPSTLSARAEPESLDVEQEPSGDRFFKAHVTWDGHDIEGGAIEFSVGGQRMRLPVISSPGDGPAD